MTWNDAATPARLALAALATGVLALLTACTSPSAQREAQDLLAQGRPAEALSRLKRAADADSRSAEGRLAWQKLRVGVVEGLLAHAQGERRNGAFDSADQLYRQALNIEPGNEPAILGLKATERERIWSGLLQQASAQIQRKNPDAARTALRAVLAESPHHPDALRLQKQIEALDVRPSQDAMLGTAYRKAVSLEFKEAPLKTVFEVLAKTAGLNFVFDKDVRTDQKVSLFLRNSTVEAAVARLLVSNQLAQRVLDANSVLIYPDTPAKQKDYQPLTVRSYYLANGEAKSVANSVKTILKVKDVVVDERLNVMIVRDSIDAVRLVDRMVALLDLPEPEVMLEVEVLEVKRSELLNLGVRWPDQVSFTPLSKSAGGQVTLRELRNLNGAAIGVTVSPLTASARRDDAVTNILANPKIRAKSREKARILIGDRVPNITTTSNSTGFVSDSVTYLDVGLKLEVEPTVFADNQIALKLALEVSSIVNQVQNKSGTLAFQIGTRSAATVLRLRDGENQVLAGLINDEDRRSASKIPLLGSAPLLGKLFGAGNDETVKTEIVLSITPRLLRNVERPDAGLLEFESGTEAGLRSRGDGPAGSPELTPSGTGASPAPQSAAPSPIEARLVAAPAPASDADVRWDAPASTRAGQIVSVGVVVDSRKPIVGIPLALGFDPKLFEVVEVKEGDFLARGGARTYFEHRIDPSGQVLVTARREDIEGVAGSGQVLSVAFRALAAAAAVPVRLLTVALEGGKLSAVTATPPAPLMIEVRP
ncbi:secretin and TonB N-terminal domain-containing protein [Aquabacterium humicola]|uniref:secretin and TonB N-terminal domain-containing protein n=1 Tax=Aquabacterium humicola TaxID=3237377 RepID=UPI002542E563|nr:secretin and TonB N-terminal domain-containing protein [Rubrivivax pictus]